MGNWMKHTIIVGMPRSGKTTLAIQMFDQLDHGCIFINTQMEDFNEKMSEAGTPMKSQSEILFRYDNKILDQLGNRKIIFNIQDNDEVVPLIRQIFQGQQRLQSINPITVFVDECHLFFPRYMNIHNNANKPIKNIFTRGSKFNLRLILISQKPQFVCPDVYTLCERMIVFKLHPNDYSYFHRHHITIPTVTEDYAYEVVE